MSAYEFLLALALVLFGMWLFEKHWNGQSRK